MITSLLNFTNIEEIKFTKIKDDLFSVTIKSDITTNSSEENIDNCIFKAGVCKLDSTLSLTVQDEYLYTGLGAKIGQYTKCYEIPMKIKLLLDTKPSEFA